MLKAKHSKSVHNTIESFLKIKYIVIKQNSLHPVKPKAGKIQFLYHKLPMHSVRELCGNAIRFASNILFLGSF